MKVLVIGSGGREHSIVKACLQSQIVGEVIAVPGNGGISQDALCYSGDIADNSAIVSFAQEKKIDFVIVGPEIPLCNGLVDALDEVGIIAYGPNKVAAQLEGSKSFTKRFLQKYNIPTALGKSFTEVKEAISYLDTQKFPIVIKASGLAAGKGVIIAQDKNEAQKVVTNMLIGNAFGASGSEVLIEKFLDGEEASITLIVSGKNFINLPASQDHKRIGEGDSGLNTGGMGAYAPAKVVTPELFQKIKEKIITPTLDGLQNDGIDFKGTLYIGIMITNDGPSVLEFNVRFGDPETQVLLPLLETDPIKLMHDCANGTLNPVDVKIKDKSAMVVVIAANGYPENYLKGDEINLPDDDTLDNVQIIHAGTKVNEQGKLVTNGGRVLGITALADNLEEAATAAYSVCEKVEFNSKYFRKDIGHRQLKN